ncbi:MAG: SRPBCC domain-containing protein [Methanomicrobiaceae archaeon]|uniref:SRPBCC domain-containing protein n=1 Tax=hydrocarbon metagenome TaxID=938273 RepID=A0A0W8FIF1_9ZZZZ|nr:SRPBCC domain-containing protein [Methanomicrobiaceae archaeon]MDD5419153.1 SRPBCC domain-containing protein [Methanomicrobiaceae archaeon]
MKEIRSEIEIPAPPEEVWEILTDFPSYPAWNPFIRSIRGELRVGSRLEVFIQPPGRRGMMIRPTVLEVEANRALRWTGRLLMPGIFDGEHRFALVPQGSGRIRFIQSEIFTGLLVPFTPGLLRNTEEGFLEMNRALRARAEGFSNTYDYPIR